MVLKKSSFAFSVRAINNVQPQIGDGSAAGITIPLSTAAILSEIMADATPNQVNEGTILSLTETVA